VRGRKLELEHFPSQHSVDICLLSKTFLNSGEALRLDNYVCQRTDRPTAGFLHSHLCSPCYCAPLSARSGPDALGGYWHPSNTVQQTGVNFRGINFSFPATDRRGPGRLFWWEITGLGGREFQNQTRGLELAADLETGETPT
jgi:hypothetical protein